MRITDEMAAAGASVKNVDTSPERDKKGDDSLHDVREAARGWAAPAQSFDNEAPF